MIVPGEDVGPILDPRDAAESAGLTYVNDGEPGLRRRKAGKGFVYLDHKGNRVRDEATLARIRSLAIPPAYTDVWICPRASGHIQATGRDAKGRKQYRYHPRWRDVRDGAKYEHVMAFAQSLPALRRRIAEDMGRRGLPREKVLATARPGSSATATAASPASSRPARISRDRSSSSTSTRRGTGGTSPPRTSTPTCARSPAGT